MPDITKNDSEDTLPNCRDASSMSRKRVLSLALWLGLLRLWTMNFHDSSALVPQSESLFYAYWLGRGIFPLLLVVAFHAAPLNNRILKATVIPCAVIAGICGLCACLPSLRECELYRLACAFVSFAGMGWIYICWHEVYASIRIYDVALSIMLSLVLSSAGELTFVLLPQGLRIIFTFVVPLLCGWATLRILGSENPDKTDPFLFSTYKKEELFPQVGSWFVMLSIYSIVIGVVNQLPAVKSFPYSSSFSFAIYGTVSILLAVLFIVLTLGKRHIFSTKAFWSVLIASIGLSFILIIAYPNIGVIVVSVFSSIKYVSMGYINVKLVDISHHVRLPLYVLMAIGWGAIEAGAAIGAGFTQFATGHLGLDLDLVFVSILALLAMGILFLSSNSRLCDCPIETASVAHASEKDLLLEQCQVLARQHGLTEREVEVVHLIAQGYTQSYAAQSLLVSLNTIRSHMKNIYAKLDIHSKNELLEALSESIPSHEPYSNAN